MMKIQYDLLGSFSQSSNYDSFALHSCEEKTGISKAHFQQAFYQLTFVKKHIPLVFCCPFWRAFFLQFSLFCKSDNYLLEKQILLMQKPFFFPSFSQNLLDSNQQKFTLKYITNFEHMKTTLCFWECSRAKVAWEWAMTFIHQLKFLGFTDRQWKRLNT